MSLICGDARYMTSYIPNCEAEKTMMEASGAKDNYSYKAILQERGQELNTTFTQQQMKKNFIASCTCDKQAKVVRPFR